MKPSQQSQRVLKHLPKILSTIAQKAMHWKAPIAGTFATGPNGVFKVLISTVLSLRTKDATTEAASHRLFAKAQTPRDMLKLSVSEIEKLIYPVGFYRVKAKNVLSICAELLKQFNGKVPCDIDTLLTFKGVGRKTANLVVTVGCNKPGICVDVHVHRLSNRWGLVDTKTPNDTESVLRDILPQKHWISYNNLLVAYGQNLCVPVSPFCSVCPIKVFCAQNDVKTSR